MTGTDTSSYTQENKKADKNMEKNYQIQSGLRITGDKKAFGPGIASLLEGVEHYGSLRKSAASMNMSYSKAWTVVKDCEKELGFLLLSSQTGGKQGGGAKLTDEGRELLKNYREFENEARKELLTLAGKYFPAWFPKNPETSEKSEETENKRPWVLVRGAGDLATGIIIRLRNCGFRVAATECRRPSAIRRRAAFCEAVWEGQTAVEGVWCRRAETLSQAEEISGNGGIPLFADEQAGCVSFLKPAAVVDAILAKKNLGTDRTMAPVTVGVGPGFTAGEDVDAVVETMRGHFLGQVIWKGGAIPNTGIPGEIGGFSAERVIHSPASGIMKFAEDKEHRTIDIGAVVTKGQLIAMVGDTPVCASIDGVLRGLIREGYSVTKGLKIADIDPRLEQAAFCGTVSDKARAVAGGVVEALLFAAAKKRIRLL